MKRVNWHRITSWIVVLAVAFGGGTFVYKLVEFASTAGREEMPGFALVSVVPYFAATFGFLLLAIWAFLRGHFKDIEEPKYRMLDQEKEYDRADQLTGQTHD
jgi:TRAP-type C4-dicarboxylate transport system permease small subunit